MKRQNSRKALISVSARARSGLLPGIRDLLPPYPFLSGKFKGSDIVSLLDFPLLFGSNHNRGELRTTSEAAGFTPQ